MARIPTVEITVDGKKTIVNADDPRAQKPASKKSTPKAKAKDLGGEWEKFFYDEINIVKESKIFKNIENKSHMYFVHSYEFIPDDKSTISATTEYSSNIVCSVEKENIFGTQFHPEKSDRIGLKLIENFLNL